MLLEVYNFLMVFNYWVLFVFFIYFNKLEEIGGKLFYM